MSSQPRPLFDSSLAALVLFNARNGAHLPPPARTRGLASGVESRRATAMSIQFAPEPDPAGQVVDLGEDETTGPLPLGFEFELFGVRYSWFDLSADGFMTFGTHSVGCRSDGDQRGRFIPLDANLNNFIALEWGDVCPLSRGQVGYEVRGAPPRRRLVLSFVPVPASSGDDLGTMTAQVVLHERTGMIDLHTRRHDPVARRINREAVRFTTAPW
jgi:hypothetical protein